MRLPFSLGCPGGTGLGGSPGTDLTGAPVGFTTTPTGPIGPFGWSVKMQWGLIDITSLVTGMAINERMGSPDTLSLQLADVDQALILSIIETLADIRVQLGTDMLFNGQVTVSTTETINYQADAGTSDNEVQRIVSAGVVANYTLTFDGQTTGTSAGTANASAVQAALEALSNLAPGDVTVTGGPLNSADLVIAFGGAYAGVNVPQITVASTAAGAWSDATAYVPGNLVEIDGEVWTCVLANTALRPFPPDYREAMLVTAPVEYLRVGEASSTTAVAVVGTDGTYVGSPTLGVAGLLTGDSDTAVSVVGGKYMSVADAAIFGCFAGTNPWTIAFWWKDGGSGIQYLFDKASADDASRVRFLWTGGGYRVDRINSGGSDALTSSWVLDTNVHMVVATYDGATIRAYFDGNPPGANTLASTRSLPALTTDVFFDSYVGGYNGATGTIDEPAIWNRALTAAEDAGLYAVGTGTVYWESIGTPGTPTGTTDRGGLAGWVAARTIDLQAEGYERLIPGALISVLDAGSGRDMPDGSYSNTGGYSIGWGHTDRDDVRGMFQDWWMGPEIDIDACVNVTGSSNYWWQYPIDNTQLGADLDALAAAASLPTVVHWLDHHIPPRFHWVDGAAGPGSLGIEYAPFHISSVGFGSDHVMSMKMTISTDAQSLVRRTYAQAALPWASGIVWNPHAVGYFAPEAMISSAKAIKWADTLAFALRYFDNDSRVGVTGTATIPPGYDGWHKGQIVGIYDPGHDLTGQGFLIQGVGVRLITGGPEPAFEYDVSFGDAPRRSLASESANPAIDVVQGPAVRYAMRTDPEQSTPTPTVPVTIIASLTDGINQLTTQDITLRWDLIISGTVVADSTDTSQAYYLEDATGTTNEQGQALTVAHTGSAYDPAANLACTVEAVTEQPA